MMIKNIVVTVVLAVLSFHTYGQKTTEELGEATFRYFQQNKLDSFYQLKPTVTELTEFGRTIGIDTSSLQYKQFIEMYPNVIRNFKLKCEQLRTDTTDLSFSWSDSRLEKIVTSIKRVYADNSDPNSKSITVTIIDIFFLSNNKRFKLSLGDANNYNGTWKPGNRIDIEELKAQ